MYSYWGIDHGEVISKAKKKDKYNGHGAPTAGRRVMAHLGGPFHGAVAGKKGKKLEASVIQAGGGLGGSIAGQSAGALTGLALGRGNPTAATIGAGLGGAAGAITGNQMALNYNQRSGKLKRQV